MNDEDRVVELEMVLSDFLECFEEGAEGLEAETQDGGIVVLDDTIEMAYQRAMRVLDQPEEDHYGNDSTGFVS